jgi:group I intron endonuclease
MKLDKEDKNKCGIYCIQNTLNNKVYIGKSINIYARMWSHIRNLNLKSKDENRHLLNSWHKYGQNNFKYFGLEYFENIDENFIKERELYWMNYYKSHLRDFGYNLRMDSSTKMIVHNETKQILSKIFSGENNPNFNNKWSKEQKLNMSIKLKAQFKEGLRTINKENCKKGSETKKVLYEKYPHLLEENIEKQSTSASKYRIYQYTKEGVLVKIWSKVRDIIKENPTYKKHQIYSVCNGYKPSIYGYVWKKELIQK